MRGLNAGFISLIPKVTCPKEVADYRPISLIGSIYKLLAKVLATRLQVVLPRLLSKNQFAFTHGRQIADCILVASEVVDFLQKREGAASYSNWTLRKHMIQLNGNFCLRSWRR